MSDDWKEKIIKEKLGGKRDWTDEERAELCHQLDKDLDKHFDSMGNSKYKDGWTEENWKEQMAEHPLFAPYIQEEGVTEGEAPLNPLSEGLAQLKFDPEHNSPTEVAQNYKEEGILQFKYKKYRLAVANFSEGVKQKCPDNELNAQLYNNRAAAHWHLGNYRSAVKDCEKAIKFNPSYMKAILRAVECTMKLKSWDEVISWCDIGLQLDAVNQKLKSARQTAVKEKKLQDRDARKKVQEEKKVQLQEELLIQAIQKRGIKLGSKHLEGSSSIKLSDLEPCHPSAQGSCVHLGENGELVWPVMFIYPEYQETDFIQEFSENDCIVDHLMVMFGPDAPPAPWDSDHKYVAKNLKVFFEDKDNKLCKVDTSCSLLQVLQHPRYHVNGGTPGLIVMVEGSKFMSEFINKYN